MAHPATGRAASVFRLSLLCLLLFSGGVCKRSVRADDAKLRLLFMGDNGHHRPESRFQQLAPVLLQHGILLQYTDRMEDLQPSILAEYDGLVLYANIDRIEDDQARAVLDFVSGGKGFVPIHCATYCWRNNPDIVALMGARFLRHGGQEFTTQIAVPDHPIMRGYSGFRSWDETYIHHQHNSVNRTVLEYRVEGEQAEGRDREPWTWVRTHGEGRVFYTAWGHDERTWGHPGFQNLIERGIRWACGDDPTKVPAYSDPDAFPVPEMTQIPADVAPFEYIDVGPKIPNYTPGQRWGEQGKPHNMMQKPLPAEESMKHFVTPQGMAVRLYADERDFGASKVDSVPGDKSPGKPIAMTWDETGRLWVCETVDYPNDLGRRRDRIRICEDTDGDQRADSFKVFADGLSIPTAIFIVRGGAVVQDGTETVYLKDTDGDDRADQRIVLISNWSLGDTHGGVSNFRYGLDNWIWAMQGYNNSTPQIDGRPTQSFRMGFWRFRLSQTDPPKVTELEFIRSSNNNTWGLGISEEGLIFGSTANHNPSMFMPIANRYYERVRGWAPATLETIADTYKFRPITDKVRQVDQFGGYTAGAGHAIYTARAFPEPYWNRTAFVCGPTGHLVGTFVLTRDGAGFRSTSPCNLLASDDEWCAPIMAEVGPDGAVWVIDWYNYIVQHNPTPQGFQTGRGNAYESDLRDKRHGRIYRVVPISQDILAKDVAETGHDTASPFPSSRDEAVHAWSSLADCSNAQLVETLAHESMRWRLHAQRLLIERNARDMFEPLIALVHDQSMDDAGLNVAAIHALHTLHALGDLNPDLRLKRASVALSALDAALKHPSGGVRRNALAVLPLTPEGLRLLMHHRTLMTDPDAQVRLQFILKLSDMPVAQDEEISVSAARLVASAVAHTTDPILLDAFTSAAAANALQYLHVVAAESVATDEPQLSHPAGQQNSEPNVANQRIARRVAEHVGRGRPNTESLARLISVLPHAPATVLDAILDGLNAGLPADYAFETSEETDALFIRLLDHASASTKGKVVKLATLCRTKALDSHIEQIVKALLDVVRDMSQSDDQRIAAAQDAINLRPDDADLAAEVVRQLTAQSSPDFATRLLQALSQSRAPATGSALVGQATLLTPQLKTLAISRALSRPDWARAVLKAIRSRQIDVNDLALDQKQALQAYPDAGIRKEAAELFQMSGGLPSADRDKVLRSLLHVAQKTGNVDSGREMFQKHCSKCHRHGDIGKTIGPNLTGMAVHPKAELLTHIIDPSRSVEGNFRMYTVVDVNGRVFNGMLASETRTSLTLIDTEGKETSIQRADIEDLVASKKSVMPDGFEKQMTEQQLADLLEFLTAKGRFVPVVLDRYATAVSTRGLFHEGDNGPDRMVFADWSPKEFRGIPFVLTDPRGKSKPNIILLHGPRGTLPPKMPPSVTLPCNTTARAIHFLSGVGGWSFPAHRANSPSMIVRLHYADGETEDHALINGIHFADYIRRVDVPGSEFAFSLQGQQIRYLAVKPKRSVRIATIELVKGDDPTAPIVMAVTIERETTHSPE